MYDYIYDQSKCVSPSDLIYFAITNDISELDVPRSNTIPLSYKYYTLLSIPYAGKHIIPEEYHKLMHNEIKYMYEKELCDTCKELTNIKKEINKDIRNKILDVDTINIKKNKLKEINNKITVHNETHKFDFSISDIREILKYV